MVKNSEKVTANSDDLQPGKETASKVASARSNVVKRQPILLGLFAFLCAGWLVFLAIVAFVGL